MFVPALLLAQTDPPAGTLAIDPLTLQQKGAYHFRKVFGVNALAKNLALASIRQANNSPVEWGRSMEGFGKRVGARYATSASYHSMTYLLGAALHEDPRYFKQGTGSVRSRVRTAAWQVFTTRTDSGGRRVAISRLSAAVGTAFLANIWQPERLTTNGATVRRIGVNFGFLTVNNLIGEFMPDIKRKFFKKHLNSTNSTAPAPAR